jgi:hypothetical protein
MPKGIIENTDIELNVLSGEHWNRATIADGKWLNKNTIQPLYNNDCILASAIHDTSTDLYNRLSDASGELQNEIDDINYEIDVINAGSDVIDVVGNHQQLMEYSGWTTDNDVIKVLNDDDYSGNQTYYRYMDETLDSGTLYPDSANWHYIGEVAPYYSKTEIDSKINVINSTINNVSSTLNGEIEDTSAILHDEILTSADNLYRIIQETSGKKLETSGNHIALVESENKMTIASDASQVMYAPAGIYSPVDLDIISSHNTNQLIASGSSSADLGYLAPTITSNDYSKFLYVNSGGNLQYESSPIFVQVTTDNTFEEIKAIILAGNIPYLVTTDSGYTTIYYLTMDGKSGRLSKYFSFDYVSYNSIVSRTVYEDDSWTRTSRTIQGALAAGDLINLDSNNKISVKKTYMSEFGNSWTNTTQVVSFPGENDRHDIRDCHRKIFEPNITSTGYYRFGISVTVRIGNLTSVTEFYNRLFRIYICTGDQTANIANGWIDMLFPPVATTGDKACCAGTLIAPCASLTTPPTVNISNNGSTDTEALFVDFVSVNWEKITG